MSEEEDDDSRMSNNSRTEQPIKPSIDPDVLARLKQVRRRGYTYFAKENLDRIYYRRDG